MANILKFIDDRQVGHRAILQQLFPNVGSQTLDILMTSLNAQVTPPLSVTATSSPSLTVNIGPSVIPNPESNRNNTIAFVGGAIPKIVSATATFPSASGGNITTSTGSVVSLILPVGDYVQVVLTIDNVSNISALVGVPNAVQANAVVPSPSPTVLPFAYITLFNSGGTIQNITQSNIFQICSPEAPGTGASSSTGWIAKRVNPSAGDTAHVINLSTPLTDLSYVVLAMMENTIDSTPQYQQVEVTDKSLSGFTLTWNAPLASNNYFINYIVPPISVQGTEKVLNSGTSSSVVTLNVPQNGGNYGIVAAMQNIIDTNPQFQTPIVTAQSATTFTETWASPTGSANYKMVYINNPTAQVPVGPGNVPVVVTLPVAYGTSGYAVVASFSNVTDAFPTSQPLILIAKNSSQFTVSFNSPAPTANYILTYYAISLTP